MTSSSSPTCWFQPGAAAPTAAELRAHGAATLPAHMVPHQFVPLAELPLTPTGKLDRRRGCQQAPLPGSRPRAADAATTTPSATLHRIWCDVLRRDDVGVHDNFFEIGGDSILCIQIVARCRKAGCRSRARQLFAHQTIAALAQHVAGDRAAAPAARRRPPRPRRPAQRRDSAHADSAPLLRHGRLGLASRQPARAPVGRSVDRARRRGIAASRR